MKAVITITETPSGNADMQVTFDPPLTRADIPKGNVGRIVLAFIEFMKSKAQSVECTSVSTKPEEGT